jgi:hypothetical protein
MAETLSEEQVAKSEEQVARAEFIELTAKINTLQAAIKHEGENNELTELQAIKRELKVLTKALNIVVEKIINLEKRHCEHCGETRKTNKTIKN